MGEKKAPKLDPLQAWREWFVDVEKQWSESLTDLMKDERVAGKLGKGFEAALHRHQMFAEAIGQYLAGLNLPSREDVLALGERMGRIEDNLAALEASVARLRAPPQAGKSAAPARPPRTRKPVKGA